MSHKRGERKSKGDGKGGLLKAFPSSGDVPSELPPFSSPCFVIAVGKGSKAMLHSTPPGTLKSYSVSFMMVNI